MARTQATITAAGHGLLGKTVWHCIRLPWPQPHGGIRQSNSLSVRAPSVLAKKPVTGPRAVGAVPAAALAVCAEIDVATGGFDGARQPACVRLL